MLWWLNLKVRDMDSNVCQEQSEGPKPDFTELSQSEKTGFFLLRGRRPAQGSTGSADSSDGEHGLVKPEASQGSALLMT